MCGFLSIEESCARDSISDVSVGVLSWYISVGFVIIMEVGDVELGLGFLYSIFTYMFGMYMDECVTRFSTLLLMVRKREGNHIFLNLLYSI